MLFWLNNFLIITSWSADVNLDDKLFLFNNIQSKKVVMSLQSNSQNTLQTFIYSMFVLLIVYLWWGI